MDIEPTINFFTHPPALDYFWIAVNKRSNNGPVHDSHSHNPYFKVEDGKVFLRNSLDSDKWIEWKNYDSTVLIPDCARPMFRIGDNGQMIRCKLGEEP